MHTRRPHRRVGLGVVREERAKILNNWEPVNWLTPQINPTDLKDPTAFDTTGEGWRSGGLCVKSCAMWILLNALQHECLCVCFVQRIGSRGAMKPRDPRFLHMISPDGFPYCLVLSLLG